MATTVPIVDEPDEPQFVTLCNYVARQPKKYMHKLRTFRCFTYRCIRPFNSYTYGKVIMCTLFVAITLTLCMLSVIYNDPTWPSKFLELELNVRMHYGSEQILLSSFVFFCLLAVSYKLSTH